MWHHMIRLIVAVFAVLNPIGNAAIYTAMVADKPTKQQHHIAFVTAIAVGIILVISTWLGIGLLKFFGISLGAFQVAGGVIVSLIGLSMLKGKPHSHQLGEDPSQLHKDNIAVVPLAIPIIAGPGAMSALISHMTDLNSLNDKLVISFLMVALALIVYLVLFFAPKIARWLGEFGMQIVTRIMGLILVAIAFQMLGMGLRALLPGLA